MLSSVSGVEKLLRTTALTNGKEKNEGKTKEKESLQKSGLRSMKKTYIRPTQDPLLDEKVFWMIKDSIKSELPLDSPKFVITLPNDYILAIERKFISLYEADGHEIDLKDYDSVGIGRKTTVCEVKHVNYRNRDYVLIFGN